METIESAAENLVSANFTIIVSANKIGQAWKWLLSEINIRPNSLHQDKFTYDRKTFSLVCKCLSQAESLHTESISYLYVVSQFTGNPNDVKEITNGRFDDVGIFTSKIEPSIRKLIDNKENFRDALSEHLAFWIQWASIMKAGIFETIIVTLPNTLPTDAGPDGLSLAFGSDGGMNVEIRSVKNSDAKDGPAYLVASSKFCKGGDATATKQLEEFFLISTAGYGFIKLDKLLSSAFDSIGKPTQKFIRAGLLRDENKFNAVIVADDKYADAEIFSGYTRVPRYPSSKIATYIGVDKWANFAEKVRQNVIEMMKVAGVY